VWAAAIVDIPISKLAMKFWRGSCRIGAIGVLFPDLPLTLFPIKSPPSAEHCHRMLQVDIEALPCTFDVSYN
jgi:hypothetical protein